MSHCGNCGKSGHYRKTCGSAAHARTDVTKQRRFQLRRREKGICIECEDPVNGSTRCDYHAGYYAASSKWLKRMARHPEILSTILAEEAR